MAVKIVEQSAVLTLDFWNEEVIYSGKAFPVGTLACDALNIPAEVIAQMKTLDIQLNKFMESFNCGTGNSALLPEVRICTRKLLELMGQHKPFSYIDMKAFGTMADKAFTISSVKSANALLQAQRAGKLTEQLSDKYKDGILMTRLLPVLAHLGYSLEAFQETMLPFAQRIHEAEQRLDVTYAEIFDAYFPKAPTFEDAGGWMSMTNVTQQYVTILHPQKNRPLLVTRNHYVSFVGMLRADFFEALRVGNAVKRCLNCGRWFLTTDAYHVKYCNDLAPGDSKGRTCRSVGAKNGVKEEPNAHPISRIYDNRRSAIGKAIKAGRIPKEVGQMVMVLADQKRVRARLDNAYFQNHYRQEMAHEAIIEEAVCLLAKQQEGRKDS